MFWQGIKVFVVNSLIYANKTIRNITTKRTKRTKKKKTFCKIRYSVAFSSRFYLVTVTVVVAVDRPKKIHFWMRLLSFSVVRFYKYIFFGVYAEHVTGKSHSWNTEIGSSRCSVSSCAVLPPDRTLYTLNDTRSKQRNSWKISRTNGNLWRQMATTIRQYVVNDWWTLTNHITTIGNRSKYKQR